MATISLPDEAIGEKSQQLQDGQTKNDTGIAKDVESPVPSLETDKYAVTWDEPAGQDPENPMSWSVARKWSIISLLSFLSFLT